MAPTFGDLLRAARNKAGFASYAQFAKALRKTDLNYADETIGNWERNLRKPKRDDVLQVVVKLSHQHGFSSVSEINQLLEVGNYDPLTVQETTQLFPHLPDDNRIPNLPPKPYHELIGRDDLIQTVQQQFGDQGAPRVVVLSGLGGIGKTALAHAVVQTVMREKTFDVLVWQSAKSEEFISTSISRRQAAANLNEALLAYGRQLGFDETQLRPDRIEQALENYVNTKRCFIVLDNLETLPAIEMIARELYRLVANSPHSRVLITSRESLVGESYVIEHPVKGLSESATTDLLRHEASRRGAVSLLQADKHLLHRLFEVTGGMPLAIQLIVTQYLLGIAVDEELDRLQAAVNEDELYRFIYFDIWHKLSLNAQKLLVGAAAVPSAMNRAALIEVSELTADSFPAAVSELVRASLMDVRSHPNAERQRYDIHAITRWFVNIVLAGFWQNPSGTNEK